MREFIAKTGGRYTYIEDFVGLQEISLSLLSLFEGCNNFVLSGCKTSGLNNSNITISEGYVFINNKIRHFEGASVDLTRPYYIVENQRTESVPYAQNATQQGCVIYECFGSDIQPTDKQCIKVSNTYIPRLKDEFFGKYAVTLNSAFDQQTISQNINLSKSLKVNGDIRSNGSIVLSNSDKQTEIKENVTSTGDAQISFSKNGDELSKIYFGLDGTLKFLSGGIEKMVITPTNVAFDSFGANELRTSEISLKGADIDNLLNSSENGCININRTGYNGSSTVPRHFNVYGGKRQLLFKVDGAKNSVISFCPFNEESINEFGLVLRDIAHSYREPEYLKSIAWKDKDGVILGSVGFSDPSKSDLIIKNEHGDVTIVARQIKVSGNIIQTGQSLDSKYVEKKYVDDELAKKVSTVAGMGLSEQNFTSSDKSKLDKLTIGNIGSGDGGAVTGDDVSKALAEKLSASNNLSDVNDTTKARENLSLFSKNECEVNYLRKDKRLSDLPTLTEDEKSQIRNAIGAAKSGDSPADSGVRTIVKEEIKGLDDKYASKRFVKDAAGNCGSLTFSQVGYIVTIGGIMSKKSAGQTLFRIPANVGKPATYLGGYIATDISGKRNNRGLRWECAAGAEDVMCIEETEAAEAIPFFITYVANKIPD